MTADAAHWDDVVALLRSAGLPTRDLDAAHADRFVTVEDGGRLLGCAAVERYGGAGLLRSVAVAEGARGAGLGGRLVAQAEAKARAEGLAALYLLTTTAAPFFEARGYRPLDRAEVPAAVRASSEFRGTCPASAACLGKVLAP